MTSSILLHASKLTPVRRGHPWVFPKAILKQNGAPKTGELVGVYADDNTLLGTGVYNQHSLYRIRMLASADEQLPDLFSLDVIVKHRLAQAKLLREALNLPNEKTTAYRLFNSEGDNLSGLTIDRFNQICVVSSTAYWVESNKPLIIKCIQEIFPTDEIIWIPHEKSLAQDGWKAQEEPRASRIETVLENGVIFQIDFAHAQKTGLFLDQRDNHIRIAQLASGKRVLDLYSYTGGFALHAAMAGASKVTAVDSSAQAITQAKENAQLNQIDHIEWIEADARDYLSNAADYDIVILDPPKLVPSHHHLQKAKNYYRFLHREVIKAMRPGALLMTCNCSSALSSSEFTELAFAQARSVGKSARVLGTYGPSSCHPTIPAFPEGNYLTAVLLGIV